MILISTAGVVAWTVLGSGGGGYSSNFGVRRDLPKPVRSEPEEEWAYDDEYVQSVSGVGNLTVVGSEGGPVVALDEDGESVWSAPGGEGTYILGPAPGNDDLVLIGDYMEEEVTALSVDDGDEQWQADGTVVATDGDAVYVATESSGISSLDPATGDENWDADADSITLWDSAVYVVDGDDLRRLDAADGDEIWSVSLDVAEDEYMSLAAVEDFVVVSGNGSVEAFDAEDGDELWSEDSDAESIYVGPLTEDSVYFAQSNYIDESSEVVGEVAAYDRDGKTGDSQEAGDFWASTIEHDGQYYLFADDTLYDEDLEPIGSYDGQVTLVDGGLYELESGGDLAYHELGESSPMWSVPVGIDPDSEEGGYVEAADDQVLVISDGELTSYR